MSKQPLPPLNSLLTHKPVLGLHYTPPVANTQDSLAVIQEGGYFMEDFISMFSLLHFPDCDDDKDEVTPLATPLSSYWLLM